MSTIDTVDELGRVRGGDLDELLAQLEDVEPFGPHGNAWKAKCPAHADPRPWLLVKRYDDGAVQFKCRLCCTPARIVAALRALAVTDRSWDDNSQTCAECGKVIAPRRRVDTRYCGTRCRVRAHRKRKLAA